jgi:hypothetical protein
MGKSDPIFQIGYLHLDANSFLFVLFSLKRLALSGFLGFFHLYLYILYIDLYMFNIFQF